VAELLDKGIVCLDNEKPVEALFNFKKAEAIINYLQASCPELEFHEYVIVFENNIGNFFCFDWGRVYLQQIWAYGPDVEAYFEYGVFYGKLVDPAEGKRAEC
jgi:hypothetical protein